MLELKLAVRLVAHFERDAAVCDAANVGVAMKPKMVEVLGGGLPLLDGVALADIASLMHLTPVRIRTIAFAVCGTNHRCVESNAAPTKALAPNASPAGHIFKSVMLRVVTSMRTTPFAL